VELSVGLTEETLGWVTSSVAIHAAPNFSYILPYSLLSEQLLSNKTSGTRTRRKTGFVLLDKYT
jgi:hypothetical protein